MRPPTMSRIVASLEREGLVRRLATEDKRRMRLKATARGTKSFRTAGNAGWSCLRMPLHLFQTKRGSSSVRWQSCYNR